MSHRLFVVGDIPGDKYFIVDFRDVLCSCSDYSVASRICDTLNKYGY